MTAQWGKFALRLFLRLGYIDENLLESIDIEGQKRREEDSKAPAPQRWCLSAHRNWAAGGVVNDGVKGGPCSAQELEGL